MDESDNTQASLTTQLIGCAPNPFNPETTISFSVKEHENAILDIFNVKGQTVKNYS
ncbi:MAG: hypothetical protein K8S56_06710 [Candidatus Cloacimonetes bacterium]|nr:hypothetical protein [Candidatus Cloacimonadota bacterium]